MAERDCKSDDYISHVIHFDFADKLSTASPRTTCNYGIGRTSEHQNLNQKCPPVPTVDRALESVVAFLLSLSSRLRRRGEKKVDIHTHCLGVGT